jgi:hypothetical protein
MKKLFEVYYEGNLKQLKGTITKDAAALFCDIPLRDYYLNIHNEGSRVFQDHVWCKFKVDEWPSFVYVRTVKQK